MPETAVPRSLDSYLRSQNPTLRAQGAYLQSGETPDGYRLMDNGMVHDEGDFKSFLDKYGWMLMAGLPAAGLGLGMALGPGAAAAGSAAPSVGATGGISAGAFPTVAGTSGAASAGGGFMAGFGIKDALSLASIIPGLFGGHGSSGDVPHSAAMEELIGLQTNRLKQSDPLYQAVLRMAMGLMPVSARGGMQMPGGQPSAMPQQQPAMTAQRRIR
jgi:hypothetical protein